VVPFDKWFGSFHDGSPEAQAAMMAKRSKARKNKPQGTSEPANTPLGTGT